MTMITEKYKLFSLEIVRQNHNIPQQASHHNPTKI